MLNLLSFVFEDSIFHDCSLLSLEKQLFLPLGVVVLVNFLKFAKCSALLLGGDDVNFTPWGRRLSKFLKIC